MRKTRPTRLAKSRSSQRASTAASYSSKSSALSSVSRPTTSGVTSFYGHDDVSTSRRTLTSRASSSSTSAVAQRRSLSTSSIRAVEPSFSASIPEPRRAKIEHAPIRRSSTLSQHVDTPYNNENTPFDFTEENMKKIQYVLKKYPSNYKQSAVKFALTLAQEQNENWLPLSAMNKVAQILDMPPIKVYEVASFYTMFNRDKVGKYHISVCGTTTCMTMGAEAIKKAAMEKAGVTKEGQISKCGNFSIKEVECTGACTNAPMVQVNYHEYYENLTPDTMRKVMDDLVEGKAKPGPQNGQSVAEGPLGQTTLVNFTDRFPQFRDFDALLAERGAALADKAVPPPPPTPAAGAKTPPETKTTKAEDAKPAAAAPKTPETKAADADAKVEAKPADTKANAPEATKTESKPTDTKPRKTAKKQAA